MRPLPSQKQPHDTWGHHCLTTCPLWAETGWLVADYGPGDLIHFSTERAHITIPPFPEGQAGIRPSPWDALFIDI